MRNVLWVDKSIECYKYILSERLEDNVNVQFFSNFEEALNTSLKTVDFVISNYNSFYWVDCFSGNEKLRDEKNYCFFLYKEITKKFPLAQFVLHSALPHTEDPLISLYASRYENFHVAPKSDLESTNNILKLITGKLDLYEVETRFRMEAKGKSGLHLVN
ncbi:MAG: hypothetical protein GY909_06850 [Oligoflexia bacterium]|nr:hypothetical protein [Oligoflexia bacterium]